MKRYSGIYAILFLILSGSCGNNPQKDAIKVMTLNIRYDNPNDSINAWAAREKIVSDFIKTEKPDLLGLQEVLYHQYEYLDTVLDDYTSIGTGRDDGAKGGEMNPVFFKKGKFDMARSKTFWLSETPEIEGSLAWGSSLPRIVTWVELVDRHDHLHFYYFNTHFSHDSDSARIMSAKLLLSKVDSITSGFPFVITGDFNMLPASEGYRILTGPRESIPLLDDSSGKSENKHEGPQYSYNGFSDMQGAGTIDYIFVRHGMKVLSHKTVVKKEHGIFISDHWPVEAVVSLK